LWGTKHPESRDLAEKMYGEMTKQILTKKEPQTMETRVDKRQYQLDPTVVRDSRINPRLVKKRPDNCLSLPHPIIDPSVK
jgi:hypothetical protein